MAPRSLSVHPAAAREIEDGYRWYLARSPTAADGFLEEIERGFHKIKAAPERWPLYLHETRRFVLRWYPFSLIYYVENAVIELVAVAHHRRRPGYWRSRL